MLKALFPPRLELGTFRVLGQRDNHYTTETSTASLAYISYWFEASLQLYARVRTTLCEVTFGSKISLKSPTPDDMRATKQLSRAWFRSTDL